MHANGCGKPDKKGHSRDRHKTGVRSSLLERFPFIRQPDQLAQIWWGSCKQLGEERLCRSIMERCMSLPRDMLLNWHGRQSGMQEGLVLLSPGAFEHSYHCVDQCKGVSFSDVYKCSQISHFVDFLWGVIGKMGKFNPKQ